MDNRNKVNYLILTSYSSLEKLLKLSSSFVQMNSIHNEIVIRSSLNDPNVREKGRGIHWICLWNNYSKPLESHITRTSPYGSKDVHTIVIHRLQRDVIEWRQQRIHHQRYPFSSPRFLQSDKTIYSLGIGGVGLISHTNGIVFIFLILAFLLLSRLHLRKGYCRCQ